MLLLHMHRQDRTMLKLNICLFKTLLLRGKQSPAVVCVYRSVIPQVSVVFSLRYIIIIYYCTS